MNKTTLRKLIKQGESETVEFKSAFDHAAIETLAAFANAEGGAVLVGVADSGKIADIRLAKPPTKTTQKKTIKDRILDLLSENPKLTRTDIAQLLGKSPNTIKGHLATLKSEKRVERIGSDRDGYWKVK
jgi:predicted HTH transcriptional regulator